MTHRLNRFNRVTHRLNRFNRVTHRLNRFNRVTHRLNRFNRVTHRLNRFNRVTHRLNRFNRVTNIGGLYGKLATGHGTAVPHPFKGGTFVKPLTNRGTIQMGRATVRINGKMAARNGDTAMTRNDPVDMPVGTVIATGTVFIGG